MKPFLNALREDHFRTAVLRLPLLALLVALAVVMIALPAPAQTAASAAAESVSAPVQIAIEPMTQVVTDPPSGYFSDPYPIHYSPWIGFFVPQTFSGTTKDLLTCQGKILPDCFQATPLTVSLDTLRLQAEAVGTKITSSEAIHPYQDNYGQWQMALSLHVENTALQAKGTWSVIVHARPEQESLIAPTSWVADKVLIGSFDKPTPANYDGKYFEDDGHLYLIYSKRLSPSPAHDGVVAQLMDSATQIDPQLPTTLLAPDDANGGFNSEYFYGLDPKKPFKLVETGNVIKIDGKYALLYSTGDYEMSDYKTGIAWSDTFLPSSSTSYKKVLMADPTGIWGQPDHLEVRYLLQSQESAWPNYVAAQVIAPGVPSVVQELNVDAVVGDQAGDWFLYFAGYGSGDHTKEPGTDHFFPDRRRPFFVRLKFAIPAGATVAGTPNMDLASWVTPMTQ